jgi:hypothetical protein
VVAGIAPAASTTPTHASFLTSSGKNGRARRVRRRGARPPCPT